MKKNFTLQLSPEEAYDPDLFKEVVLKKAGVSAATPQTFARQTRRSIDARGRKVLVNVEAELFVNETPGSLLDHFPTYENVAQAEPIVIVGAGPAGLFAALRAIELGVKPILLERGKDVRARRRDLACREADRVDGHCRQSRCTEQQRYDDAAVHLGYHLTESTGNSRR